MPLQVDLSTVKTLAEEAAERYRDPVVWQRVRDYYASAPWVCSIPAMTILELLNAFRGAEAERQAAAQIAASAEQSASTARSELRGMRDAITLIFGPDGLQKGIHALAAPPGLAPERGPRFRHDCDDCRFLGSLQGRDVYLCAKTPFGQTLVVRDSDVPEDTASGREMRFAGLRLSLE